jgi:hypothetical protein
MSCRINIFLTVMEDIKILPAKCKNNKLRRKYVTTVDTKITLVCSQLVRCIIWRVNIHIRVSIQKEDISCWRRISVLFLLVAIS